MKPVVPPARLAPAPLERLAKEPQRFGFDAGVRVLLHSAGATDPGSVVRFRSVTGLAYPPADILRLALKQEGVPPDMVVSVMGLIGPSGVLPRSYTETVNRTLRSRSDSLRDFLDMLSHRMLALFASAGMKYRPNRIFEISQLVRPCRRRRRGPVHRRAVVTDRLWHTASGRSLLGGSRPVGALCRLSDHTAAIR